MRLEQGLLSIEVPEDNPLYPILINFIGQDFSLKSDIVPSNEKINFTTDEPSQEDFIAELLRRAKKKKEDAPKITVSEEEDGYFNVSVNPSKVYDDLNKLFIEDNTIKSILVSHIRLVLGVSEDSSLKSMHYKASEKYSSPPYITIYRIIPGKGAMYLTVREDVHDAHRE